MEKWLTFSALQDAQNAEQQISDNMGLPAPGVNAENGEVELNKQHTTRWAKINLTVDDSNLWVFPKPENQYMENVSGYVEMDYDPEWFPVDIE